MGWYASESGGGEEGGSLFPGDSVTAHAFSRLGNLGQDILTGEIASSDDAGANREALAIAPEPAPGGPNHDGAKIEEVVAEWDVSEADRLKFRLSSRCRKMDAVVETNPMRWKTKKGEGIWKGEGEEKTEARMR